MSKFAAAKVLKTPRDLIRYAVSHFSRAGLAFGHGSDNSWDEAVYLVLATLALPLDQLDPFLDARLLPDEVEAVLEVIARRAAGTPAAYLTHEAWLGDYRFYVDERAIIPRSLIAELLFDGLSPWITKPQAVTRILDLCCGSAALAIIAADVFPQATVDAVDISEHTLAVAARNRADYGLDQRIRLVHSDLFDGLAGERYDLILCNPPYVNEAAMQALPMEYRHEPRLALAGGPDGMDLVRRILAAASRHLKRNRQAALVLEIGHERLHFDAAFPALAYTAVETSAGGDEVLYIEADALKPLAS